VQPRAYNLTVLNQSRGRQIPDDFLGLSMEVWDLPQLAGSVPEAGVNPDFLRLLELLDPSRKHPVQVRVGAGSAQDTWFGPEATAASGITYTVSKQWWDDLAAIVRHTGASVVLTANRARGTAHDLAKFARAATSQLPDFTVEPDNEPDLYAREAAALRSEPYAFSEYQREWRDDLSALASEGLGAIPLAGPSASADDDSWLHAVVSAAAAGVYRPSMTTWHYYPLSTCGSAPTDPWYPTINLLSSQWLEAKTQRTFRRLVSSLTSVGLRARIDEAGNVGCLGKQGVSDSLAAGLWAINTLFDAASAGVSGFDFHNETPLPFSPILKTRTGRLYVTATYYGMKLFADAVAGPSTHLAPLAGAQTLPAGVRGFATIDARGWKRIVLTSTARGSEELRIRASGAPQARETVLTASSLGATSDLSYGGTSLTPDAHIKAKRIDRTKSGYFDIRLAGARAILLVVPPMARP